MGLLARTVTIASALAGLAVFSQAPEFAQQYRQRIGGAVDELKTVVADFDTDAAQSQMSRDGALDRLKGSPERFARDRGITMGDTIGRFERLSEQQKSLEIAHPLSRPLQVLRYPDRQVLNSAWEIYQPAVPLNSSGAFYGGFGALLAMVLARFGIGGARRLSQHRSDKTLVGHIEPMEAMEIADISSEPTQQALETHKGLPEGIPSAMQVDPVNVDDMAYMKLGENRRKMKAAKKISGKSSGRRT